MPMVWPLGSLGFFYALPPILAEETQRKVPIVNTHLYCVPSLHAAFHFERKTFFCHRSNCNKFKVTGSPFRVRFGDFTSFLPKMHGHNHRVVGIELLTSVQKPVLLSVMLDI